MMKTNLMDILQCIYCKEKGELELQTQENQESGVVNNGSILCKGCKRRFPIIDGIPRFLPDELRVNELVTTI